MIKTGLRSTQWLIAAVMSMIFLCGCATSASDAVDGSARSTSGSPEELTTITAQSSNIDLDILPRLEGKATVVMTVNEQPIAIEVDGEHAPITAGNFVDLVAKGVYDGLMFHRVIRSPEPFVAQGGDPVSADPKVGVGQLGAGSYVDPGTNRPRYIPLEIQPEGEAQPVYGKTLKDARVQAPPVLTHQRGAVAMARSQMPDSASAQFYFALSDLAFLDGSYAVFGYVTDGMTAVDNIQQGDRIDSAVVTEGIGNLRQP